MILRTPITLSVRISDPSKLGSMRRSTAIRKQSVEWGETRGTGWVLYIARPEFQALIMGRIEISVSSAVAGSRSA